MTRIITYSLLNNHKRSDQYYEVVAGFTDEVLLEMHSRVGRFIPPFIEFLARTHRETPRSAEEYELELLCLGTFWQVYAQETLGLNRSPMKFISQLVRVRKKSKLLKPIVDWMRGILGALFLNGGSNDLNSSPAPVSMQTFRWLLDWLSATGDFPDEVKRLEAWYDYLQEQPEKEARELFKEVLQLASWFADRSLDVLGVYTPNVDEFLADGHQKHLWSEDRYFTGRRRVEYHVTMVATEILNRNMRSRFLESQRKIVIAPPCMCAPEDTCQAQLTPFGYLCAHCTSSCRVHQMTLLGEKHGFEVLVMPDDLDVFGVGESQTAPKKSLGVVGISCPLTNPGGHWDTRDIGVPAQGLLLDYCGCSYHWGLEEHFPTDTNFVKLLEIIGKD